MFSDKLKTLRIQSGLSQSALATRLGVKPSIISSYEGQLRFPSIEVLKEMSKVFGVSIEYLLDLQKHQTLDVSDLTDEQVAIVSSIVNEYKRLNKK